MRETDVAYDPWGMDSPSVEQALADDNLRAQDALWAGLEKARTESQRSLDEVAACLKIPLNVVEAIRAGRMNISLSDLREYAYSVNALITYKVSGRYTQGLEDYRRLIVDASSQPWHSLPARQDDESVSVKRRVEALAHER